jgi:hypothetical protein
VLEHLPGVLVAEFEALNDGIAEEFIFRLFYRLFESAKRIEVVCDALLQTFSVHDGR